MPIITPANALTGIAYGNNAYVKPSLGYLAVKEMLGDTLFKKCLLEYMDRWHSKHPIPWDFFYTFNNVSGKNLNWFWNNWFFSNGYIDIALQNVVKNKKNTTVYVQNIGGFATPFDVAVTYADGTVENAATNGRHLAHQSESGSHYHPSGKTVQSANLKEAYIMDADESNNSWKKK